MKVFGIVSDIIEKVKNLEEKGIKNGKQKE